MNEVDKLIERLQLRAAGQADLEQVNVLLSLSKLPKLDDAAQFPAQYVVALVAGGDIAGVAGLEIYGNNALLRSVAVAAGERSMGLGRRLTENRLQWAAEHGVTAVYLLTTDASEYWHKQQFTVIQRSDAPEGVRSSSQWAGGCSSCAIAMMRPLTQPRYAALLESAKGEQT